MHGINIREAWTNTPTAFENAQMFWMLRSPRGERRLPLVLVAGPSRLWVVVDPQAVGAAHVDWAAHVAYRLAVILP